MKNYIITYTILLGSIISKKLTKLNKIWLLFYTFAKIALLVVGGGLAMLPVIEETFVKKKKLITDDELLDMVAMTQTLPGIVAVNSAIYIGMKVAGYLGALAAAFGAILPSFTIILIIAIFFPNLNPENEILLGAFLGVRACITALILATAIKIFKKSIKNLFEVAMVIIFLACALGKINPAYIILVSMPLGCIYAYVLQKKMKGGEK